MSPNSVAPGDNELAVSDLGPLAWVLDELRKSLDGAAKALKRFVRDAELARGANLSELDASQLRIARQQLHQAVGALEMVGLTAPAKVLRAMEALAQKFVQHPEQCSEDATLKVERASFALMEYLEGVLKGKKASPVALFPQYRAVLELIGADKAHPADLWTREWRWQDVVLPSGVTALPYSPGLRSRMDQDVLRVMKSGDVQAARRMGVLCVGLAAGQQRMESRSFWMVCAAFFEALALNLCPGDVYAKRAASRVLGQYASLAKGDTAISERLAHDLVFFCSIAQPVPATNAPLLDAVCVAYGLVRGKPIDYETEQFGRFDPAMMVLARKRIAAAAETWSALAGGDANRLRGVLEQFSSVADSVVKLHAEGAELARALVHTVETTARSGAIPTPSVAMEVATAVLYLEAAYDDLDPTEHDMAERGARLAQRLEHVRVGGQPEPLESWMEDLYRRVSDRQTMGSVVDELRTTLGEVEHALDQFFRNPQDRSPLHEVPSKLAQMRGVFSVLGLDQPALAALRMRASVEKFLVDEIDESAARRGIFEKLGNSLGALGFLIDMLSYQRSLAKKLFVYDEDLGEFKPLMGRERSTAPKTEVEVAVKPVLDTTPPTVPPVVVQETPRATVSEPVLAAAGKEIPPTQPVEKPAAAVVAATAAATVAATTGAVDAPRTPVAPAVAAPAAVDDDDAELLEIFLDEAREVVQNGLAAAKAVALNPADLAEQTTLRRAFHTLKGSSRMVGLTEFGEAAWSFEQLLNTWLAEQRPASSDLITAATSAMQAFGNWVEDIASHSDVPWNAQDFRKSSDSLRLHGRWVPLRAPAGGDDAVVEATTPAPGLETPKLADLPAAEVEERIAAVEEGEGEVASLRQEAAPAAEPEPLVASQEQGTQDTEPLERGTDFAATQTFGFEATQAFNAEDARRASDAYRAATEVIEGDFGDFDFTALKEERKPETVATPEPVQPPPEVGQVHPVEEAPLPGDAMAEVVAEVVVEVVEPHKDMATPQEVAVLEEDESEESVKVIGSLRLSIPLYNVYLNEADEWSRRLQTEMSEWAMELQVPLPQSLVSLAHSLRGSSATVGFMALSQMARLLEQALQHVQVHRQGTAELAQVFTNAAEDIRRLLHQFAAGFLKESDPAILVALQQIIDTEFPEPVPVRESDALDDYALPSDEEDMPEVPEPVEAPTVVPTAPQPVATPVSVAAAPLTVARAHDDDIDAVDQLDDDLFPIFQEEAAEFFPNIAAGLRQWVDHPDDLDARRQVLRVLHTLKGSARLAGAMRLGEMAHRMESSIEQIGVEQLQSVQLEPLLARFDAIQDTFSRLGAAPTPEESVPEAVSAAGAPQSAGMAKEVSQAGAPVMVARSTAQQSIRVRSQLVDRLVNQAGEVMISRARLEAHLAQLRSSLTDLSGNLDRLRNQLRDVELQSESQMQSRLAQTKDSAQAFDPLEFDRFTRVQELTRMMAESVHDVATVQRNLQRSIEGAEDDLIAQGRQARELQRDLLRTRMTEFESISERLYGVVRQAGKDAGKQVKLDISGGSIEMDRGVLERMAPAFEHILRNSVAHGIESSAVRASANKSPIGTISIHVKQESNDVAVSFRDDGAGLHLAKIRAKAIANGLIAADAELSPGEAANLIWMPGFSTADKVTELSGRGVGMDVVRAEVNSLGGRIETSSEPGMGTTFTLVLPLTTAVTQVVMLRIGDFTIGVPSGLVEVVLRTPTAVVAQAYKTGGFDMSGQTIPFFWGGSLLQASAQSGEMQAKYQAVAVFRSAGQRLAMHVDEILGNREVVVKNLGPQLVHLPGLAAVSVLPSGSVALIYNPVALAAVYGEQARRLYRSSLEVANVPGAGSSPGGKTSIPAAGVSQVPLVLVVDDSITVRRVTQRLLKREGYRVTLASDGLDALEKLQEERPAVVLSDIEMPRMDGFDLARNIRSDANLSDLPIIMITSRIAVKHREHAKQLGVDHYLGKPYSEDELLGLVRSYCAVKESV